MSVGCLGRFLLPDGPLELERWTGFVIADHTLSKSARLGPPKVTRVRDLGCLFWVVCDERLRT